MAGGKMTDVLDGLAARWREEAETFRCYGAERLARACEKHADELEAAASAAELEAVTLGEASEIGGYSYSHLQHLVRDGEIENVGEKGAPRIRRCDVPVKPGQSTGGGPTSKTMLLDHTVQLHRDAES